MRTREGSYILTTTWRSILQPTLEIEVIWQPVKMKDHVMTRQRTGYVLTDRALPSIVSALKMTAQEEAQKSSLTAKLGK